MEHANHIKNQKIQYIHKESNHPPNIIKQITITIEKQFSNHSSNKTVYRHATKDYEKTLEKLKYNVKLQIRTNRQIRTQVTK